MANVRIHSKSSALAEYSQTLYETTLLDTAITLLEKTSVDVEVIKPLKRLLEANIQYGTDVEIILESM